MNENLVNQQFQQDMIFLEKMNDFNSKKEKRGIFYQKLQDRAGTLMEMIMGDSANPLDKNDIKKFNVELQKKVFSEEDSLDASTLALVRDYIFNQYKLNIIPKNLKEEEEKENGAFNKAKKNYEKIVEKYITENGETYIQDMLENNNNDKKTKKSIFEMLQKNEDKNYLIEQKTKETMSFTLGEFSFNLVFSESYLKIMVDKIYNSDVTYLKEIANKEKGIRLNSVNLALNFLEKNKNIIKQEMKNTLRAYNTSIFSRVQNSFSSFKGFYGEAMTGVLLKSFNKKIKTEQVGANKEAQRSTKRKQIEYLKQTPTDVVITVDNKKYRFQVKQWTNDSLQVHLDKDNKLVGGLGRTSVEYIGDEKKDLRYFYESNKDIQVIQRLIKAPINMDNPEDSKYLEKQPNLFRHLVFGAFRIETFLPYAKKYVGGNDFFSIRGYLIPSAYFIMRFLEEIENESNRERGLITITTSGNKYWNNRPLDSFRVSVNGLSVNIKEFDIF